MVMEALGRLLPYRGIMSREVGRRTVLDSRTRIVSTIPINDLWDDQGAISARKVSLVGKAHIQKLLRSGQVRFVLADIGKPLEWIEPNAQYSFWKNELSPHLAEPSSAEHGVSLDEWPDGYCYFASEWRLADECVVIVAERYH
jgi:hypothetical protein